MRLEKPNRNINIVQFCDDTSSVHHILEYQFEMIIIDRPTDIYFLKLHQNIFES